MNFEGKIVFKNKHQTIIDYYTYMTSPYEYDFHSLMMTSFTKFKFSKIEKIKLSNIYRKKINHFLNINMFELKSDAEELINKINSTSVKHLTIEASNYGAYVCLAALFSGKLNKEQTIQFDLSECPIKLFPEILIKKDPSKKHVYNLLHDTNCWTSKIKSMQFNKTFVTKTKKAA